MIGVHCQLVICREHIRLLKNIFCTFLRLALLLKNWPETQISQFFMICGPILKCQKWVGRSKIFSEVYLNIVYGVSNLKTGKFFTRGSSGANLIHHFSEHCCPFGPLVGDLIKHHLKVTGSVYRFRKYKIFVSTLIISGDINFSIFVIIFWILDNYSNFW